VYLLLQTVGVLAAAVLLVRIFRPSGDRSRYATAAVAVVTVLSLVLFFAKADRGVKRMSENRDLLGQTAEPFCAGAPCKAFLGLSESEGIDQVGARLGVNVPFVNRIRERVEPGERYYLVITKEPSAAAFPQWITYRLLPRLATGIEGHRGDGRIEPGSRTAASEADWVIYYGVDPRRSRTARSGAGAVETFEPKFHLARVSR
jgi:hypothetical protein